MFAGTGTETLHTAGSDSRNRVGFESIKPTLEVRLATSQDIEDYYGEPPKGTLRAYVALLDGQVAGFIGIVREQAVGKLFCDFKPELQPYLQSITIMRAVKASMKFAEQYKGPIVAIAEHAEGCRILHRLGWTHLKGDLYGWLN